MEKNIKEAVEQVEDFKRDLIDIVNEDDISKKKTMSDNLGQQMFNLSKKIAGFSFIVFLSFCMLGAKEITYKEQYMYVLATAYCNCVKCTGKVVHDGKTATMKNAYAAGIAVDPKIIPLGSRIDCAEYTRRPTWCPANDVGGKINNYHIDLRMKTHQEAVEFGEQWVKIRVWTEVKEEKGRSDGRAEE